MKKKAPATKSSARDPDGLPDSLLSYTERVGAEKLNFRRFMVKVKDGGGYYTEKTLITINVAGDIACSNPEHAPTEEEAAKIKTDMANCKFPVAVRCNTNQLAELQKKMKASSTLYPIYTYTTPEKNSKRDNIVMVQERRENEETVKSYIPWTYFSDGKWRAMEPEGGLPFYKPAKKSSTSIMVHEGAKAAKAAAELPKSHPWYETMQQYDHWGILGGAKAPHRADYAELQQCNPTELIYMADNDPQGKAVVPVFSQMYGKRMQCVTFDSNFKMGWDIADPLPDKMFTNGTYIGLELRRLFQPATWATRVHEEQEGAGRKRIILRDEWAREWIYVGIPELFVHVDHLYEHYDADTFNALMRPFSHVDNVARLARADFQGKVKMLDYRPDIKATIDTEKETGRTYLNAYQPSTIEPEEGDPAPWLKYMEHLVPDKDDRRALLRWCATLIARPDIRMQYSVLLISETQGVGKTTLGERILAPLVGHHNTSTPNESDISDSAFNGWVAHKRLVVVNEIYAGHSSKVYTRLKSVITDDKIAVNKKFQEGYTCQNWCHVLASSNSTRAIKVDTEDRRWLIPKVTEERKSTAWWREFNVWLTKKGGLHIIAKWAQDFTEVEENVVLKGEHAPPTATKNSVVADGYSPGEQEVQRLLQRLQLSHEALPQDQQELPLVVFDIDLVEYVKHKVHHGGGNGFVEAPVTLRRVARHLGWKMGSRHNGYIPWGLLPGQGRAISPSSKVQGYTPKELDGMGIKPLRYKDFHTL